jgi:hypothetical protein
MYTIYGAEDSMFISLTNKFRLNSNLPLFQERLLSNQDVPGIERKHGQKFLLVLFYSVVQSGVRFKLLLAFELLFSHSKCLPEEIT